MAIEIRMTRGEAGEGAYAVDDNLGYLANRTARLMAQMFSRRLQRHGVALAQWAILLFLYAKDGQTQRELSRVVAIEPPTVARTIDRMVRDVIDSTLACDYAAIASPNSDEPTARTPNITLYQQIGDDWSALDSITPPEGTDPYGPESFGSEVAMRGTDVIIGAPDASVIAIVFPSGSLTQTALKRPASKTPRSSVFSPGWS